MPKSKDVPKVKVSTTIDEKGFKTTVLIDGKKIVKESTRKSCSTIVSKTNWYDLLGSEFSKVWEEDMIEDMAESLINFEEGCFDVCQQIDMSGDSVFDQLEEAIEKEK